VADRRHRLALPEEVADEGDGVLVRPELIRVSDAAGEHERVVLVGARLLDGAVDRDPVGRIEVVEPLDLAVLEGDDLDRRARVLERLPRLDQLDLLEHVGGEDRHPLALELVRHRILLGVAVGRPRGRAAPQVP
jgi:hypothetical protein